MNLKLGRAALNADYQGIQETKTSQGPSRSPPRVANQPRGQSHSPHHDPTWVSAKKMKPSLTGSHVVQPAANLSQLYLLELSEVSFSHAWASVLFGLPHQYSYLHIGSPYLSAKPLDQISIDRCCECQACARQPNRATCGQCRGASCVWQKHVCKKRLSFFELLKYGDLSNSWHLHGILDFTIWYNMCIFHFNLCLAAWRWLRQLQLPNLAVHSRKIMPAPVTSTWHKRDILSTNNLHFYLQTKMIHVLDRQLRQLQTHVTI